MRRIIGIDLTGEHFRAAWFRDSSTAAIDVLERPPPAVAGINRDGRLVAGDLAAVDGVARFGDILATIDDSDDNPTPFQAGATSFRAEAVWAVALATVRAAVERQAGIGVSQCVVAMPAEILRRDAERMRRAGMLAGMPVLRMAPAACLSSFNQAVLNSLASVRLVVAHFEKVGASISFCEGGDQVLESLGEIRVADEGQGRVEDAIKRVLSIYSEGPSRLIARGDATRANAFAASAKGRFAHIQQIEADSDRDAAAKGAGLHAAVLQGDARDPILLNSYPARVGYEQGGKLVAIVDHATTTPARKSVSLRSKRPAGDLGIRLYESSLARPDICAKGFLGEFVSHAPDGPGDNIHEVTISINTDHTMQISCTASRRHETAVVEGEAASWAPFDPPAWAEDQYAVLRAIELLDKTRPAPDTQFDFFVSHSSADAARAQQLVEHLEAAGKTCWIAPRNVPGGKDFATEIINGLKASRELVLIYSANAARSRHVLREFLFMAEANRRIFPVMLDGTDLVDQFEYYLLGVQRIAAVSPQTDAMSILKV